MRDVRVLDWEVEHIVRREADAPSDSPENTNVVESASAICANMANSLGCMNALEERGCTREDASLFVL